MKKIMFSLLAIATVSAIAGVSSYALWSDSETSEGNYMQASYMDMTLGSEPIMISNVVPGQTGTAEITIKNDSPNVNATLEVTAASLIDYENWCVEPEKNEGQDPSCSLISDTANLPTAPPFVGANKGELSEHVKVQFFIGSTPVSPEVTLAQLKTIPTPISVPGQFSPGQEVTVRAEWKVDNNNAPADNIFMTDAVMGDFVVTMKQATN